MKKLPLIIFLLSLCLQSCAANTPVIHAVYSCEAEIVNSAGTFDAVITEKYVEITGENLTVPVKYEDGIYICGELTVFSECLSCSAFTLNRLISAVLEKRINKDCGEYENASYALTFNKDGSIQKIEWADMTAYIKYFEQGSSE